MMMMMIEPSVCCCDAALRQITLTACLHFIHFWSAVPEANRGGAGRSAPGYATGVKRVAWQHRSELAKLCGDP